MTQSIKLIIENNIPSIHFINSESSSKKLTQREENIEEIILDLALKLGIKTKEEEKSKALQEILEIASEGEIGILESEIPDLDVSNVEFEIREGIQKNLDLAMSLDHDYSNVEMNELVKDELERNYKVDILASIIDQIYEIIVAKVILAAYELELNSVIFESNNNFPRLTEKLGNELQKLDFDFKII